MKHFKLFKTNSEYEEYQNNSEWVLPNVCYIIEKKKIRYNPRTHILFETTDGIFCVNDGEFWVADE